MAIGTTITIDRYAGLVSRLLCGISLFNKWRYELNADESSFKEFSVANDEHGQAVYMERWARVVPGKTYEAYVRDGPSHTLSVLVIVGNCFALARRLRPLPKLPDGVTGGGMAGIVDALLDKSYRSLAEEMLHFEGSFGFTENWVIELSTIPWRKNQSFKVEKTQDGLLIDGSRYDLVASSHGPSSRL
eukprot:GEMP01062209.1.p1 GENE.GEMP01062209.1~~GEMP01062209.1.p1  ORF type:complete len:188 (+),score=28.60 GEMP01062209.1:392-955(+)